MHCRRSYTTAPSNDKLITLMASKYRQHHRLNTMVAIRKLHASRHICAARRVSRELLLINGPLLSAQTIQNDSDTPLTKYRYILWEGTSAFLLWYWTSWGFLHVICTSAHVCINCDRWWVWLFLCKRHTNCSWPAYFIFKKNMYVCNICIANYSETKYKV